MTTSLGLVDAFEKAAQIRRNRSRGLRDLSQFSPVAANRDAAAGAKMSTAASTREAVPPGAPTVAYTPGATRPEPSTRQWTPTPSVRVTRDTRAEGSSSEPVCIGLGQMSRAEGDTARDAVPAPPGRAAGVHVDPRGPQPQGDLEDLAVEAGVREYVSRLWAEDWNSAEDSAYDAEAAS